MVALAAMQGLGKPGSNIWGTTAGAPVDRPSSSPATPRAASPATWRTPQPGSAGPTVCSPRAEPSRLAHHAGDGQTVPRLRIPEAMLHERLEWRGKGFCGSYIEAQFREYHYPAEGYPPIGMYYRYGGSFFGTMTETNRYVKAYQNDKIPFVVNQSIWIEGEAKFADIILPACTNFERWDIGECANAAGYVPTVTPSCSHRMIVLQKKCIEPLGESKSDYEIFAGLAQRLGVYGAVHMGGKTELDWVKQMFHASDLPKAISWEDFEKKGYYVVPPSRRAAHARTPLVRRRPAAETRRTGARTPPTRSGGQACRPRSGKIEFVASSLKRLEEGGTVDPERPAMGPQYIESWEGHHTAELLREVSACSWSLPILDSASTPWATPRIRWTNEVKDHRVLKEDGRYYWIIRISTRDAAARGIADGDLVRAFNDRGSVILAAQVTERVPPGTVHSYESCADYDPAGAPGESPDRAGCVNILTPKRFITPTSTAMANNSCLIEVEKWEG